ncbi:MAG TPA: EF-hand domain-containing protein [Vicinamibacteria bacterium]|nr:EF-hand domain-containing protein [Vicinamibacteria bacterium]
MRGWTTYGLVTAALLAAIPARADGPGGTKAGEMAASREAKFREWDKNGDGSLQKGEYPGHPGNFRALDRDGNGSLSLEEFVHRAGAAAPEAGDAFSAKDHDRDGHISRSEWPDPWEFDRRDRNRDGRLTREEYDNPREVTSRDAEFRKLDANNDGSISRSEWRGQPSLFGTLDRDDDGLVSRDEYVKPRGGALTKE